MAGLFYQTHSVRDEQQRKARAYLSYRGHGWEDLPRKGPQVYRLGLWAGELGWVTYP